MKETVKISASIVLYHEDIKDLNKTVQSFLSTPLSKRLYLIDNTPKALFKNKFTHADITYIPNYKNLGFGAAHNKILDKIDGTCEYHLILNPDVTFTPLVIPNLLAALEKDEDVAMIAPSVLFPDGKHQYSCRKFPTFNELLVRRVGVLKYLFRNIIEKGEYRDKDLSKAFFPEYITGCFQLYKTKDLLSLKGFDERYFLYMEDVDICRKIDVLGKKKLYYPNERITHILKQGSTKSIKLFFIHLISAIKYFRKWKTT